MVRRRRIALTIGRFVVVALVATAMFRTGEDARRPELYVFIDDSAPPAAVARWGEIANDLDADVVITEGLSANDLAAAVDEALWQGTADSRPTIVIESAGDWPASLAPVVRRLHEAGDPVRWLPVDTRASSPRVVSIAAPPLALNGQEIAIVANVAVAPGMDVEAELLVDGEPSQRLLTAASGPIVFRERVTRSTAATYRVRLLSTESGLPVTTADNGVVVNVRDTPEIWVITAGESVFAESLAGGGWRVVRVLPEAFSGRLDDFDTAAAVVLDDVATTDLPETAWGRITDAVQQRGLGLIVLGGPQAYGLGGYRRSTLESVLPLVSEPPADEIPASLLFLVDISGSMDRDRGVGSRLAVARQAVTETAKLVRPSDRVGLIAFDVEPRMVLPLESRANHVAAIEQSWPAGASGGTSLSPSLRQAMEILRADSAETQLIILISDGNLADSDLLQVGDMLGDSEAGLVAMIIADEVDANFRALAELARGKGGNAVLVNDVLELPALMRQEAELQRPAVVIGPAPVRELRRLPWLVDERNWPAVDAYALTRPVDGAEVFLASERGDPLIASKTSGLGRVISVTPGFSGWSRSWLAWQQWPDFSAGLMNYALSRGREGTRLFIDSDFDGSRTLVLDSADRHITGPLALHLRGPAGVAELALELEAPGRLSAELAPGHTGRYSLFVPGLAEPLRHDLYVNAVAPQRGNHAPIARRWQDEGLLQSFDQAAFAFAASGRIAPLYFAAAALILYLLVMVAERELPGYLKLRRRRAAMWRFRPFAADRLL